MDVRETLRTSYLRVASVRTATLPICPAISFFPAGRALHRRFLVDSSTAVLNQQRHAPPGEVPFPFPAFPARFLRVGGSPLSVFIVTPWTEKASCVSVAAPRVYVRDGTMHTPTPCTPTHASQVNATHTPATQARLEKPGRAQRVRSVAELVLNFWMQIFSYRTRVTSKTKPNQICHNTQLSPVATHSRARPSSRARIPPGAKAPPFSPFLPRERVGPAVSGGGSHLLAHPRHLCATLALAHWQPAWVVLPR